MEEFSAFLSRALQHLGDELRQAHARASAEHVEERCRLAGEVAQLQAALQAAQAGRGGAASVPAWDDSSELPEAPLVAQPPPAARVPPLLAQPLGALGRPAGPTQAAAHGAPAAPGASGQPASAAPQPVEPATEPAAQPPARPAERALCASQFASLPFLAEGEGEGEESPTSGGRASSLSYPWEETSPKAALNAGAALPASGAEPQGEGMFDLLAKAAGGAASAPLTPGRGSAPKPHPRSWSDMPLRGSQSFGKTRGQGHLQRRLEARLGRFRAKGIIRGRDLHQALSGLGLEKYSPQDINRLMYHVAMVISLRWPDNNSEMTPGQSDVTGMTAQAEWRWPDEAEVAALRSASDVVRHMSMGPFKSIKSSSHLDEEADHGEQALPWKALSELFFRDEEFLEKAFGPSITDQIFTIRELLLTGEANRIISQLTFVKIDDLATTNRRRRDCIRFLDPAVGAMILLNGLAVGIQADPSFCDWEWWHLVQACFTAFFLAEILVRLRLDGCRQYCCGPERLWNALEVALVAFGVVEAVTETMGHESLPFPSLFRFLRFARVLRLLRVLRLSFALELRLMVKGILSGIRTLLWAFVLLVFAVYALGVAAAMTFADSVDEHVKEEFHDVPTSMFTAFRCFSGECLTASGGSLASILFFEYGWPFAVVHTAAYMLISLGLFNVILAIYVDITMVAAKQTDDANKGRHERESIRVAQLTKRLLKMFCAAHDTFSGLSLQDRQRVDLHSVLVSADTHDIEIDDDMSISKELYLLVTQDPAAQKVMDELDIPPDRPALFDCFDADGSGSLEATELVRGFLKVRGELKKADHVACVLALRSIQITLKQMEHTLEDHRQMLVEHVSDARATLMR